MRHARPRTPTPSGAPADPGAFLVVDRDLPDRPPLGPPQDYAIALRTVAAVQAESWDQLEANGEGGGQVELGLDIIPVDQAGKTGPACYSQIVNGLRPATR